MRRLVLKRFHGAAMAAGASRAARLCNVSAGAGMSEQADAQMPAVNERFGAQGSEMVGSSPEEFAAHIAAELKRWAGVVKTAGITAE